MPHLPPAGKSSDAVFSDPAARAAILNQLYDALSQATDPAKAARIDAAIRGVWHRTGSPTIDVLLRHAQILDQHHDYATALKVLDDAVALAPRAEEAWNERAMVHFQMGQDAKALADLSRVLAIDPKHYEAMAGLGRVLEQLGHKGRALSAYEKALKIDPFMEPVRQAIKRLTQEQDQDQNSGQDVSGQRI